MEDTGELPKRARYYQGMCDLDVLAKGVSYDELREQYRKDPITKKAYMTLEQELNIRYKKGRDEEKRELAKALRVQGKLTLDEIASVSGLTPEEIKAL